jgi:hypothetical protein
MEMLSLINSQPDLPHYAIKAQLLQMDPKSSKCRMLLTFNHSEIPQICHKWDLQYLLALLGLEKYQKALTENLTLCHHQKSHWTPN